MSVAVLLVAQLPATEAQSVAQQFGATNKCVKACDPVALNGGAPKRASETVSTVLYAHFRDPSMVAPMTTTPPDPAKDPPRGSGTMPCIDTRTGTPGDVHFGGCEFRMFSAAVFDAEDPDSPIVPGIGRNTTIVSDTINLYVTLSARSSAPHVGIHARLETPKFPYGRQVLAESDRQDPATRKQLIGTPGDPYDAWEYEIKMKVRQPLIPAIGGFVVAFRVYQLDEGPGTTQTPGWELRYGAKYPPRLVLETREPLTSEGVRLHTWKNALFARWSFMPAFAGRDIYAPGVLLRQSAGPRLAPGRIEFVILHSSPDHTGYLKPLNATWRIDYAKEHLPDGRYEFIATATNLQRTYILEQNFSFDVEAGRPQVTDLGPYAKRDSPGPGFLAAVASVAGAILFGRLRQR